jgi:F-type H+-transporting ATPase subunit delta
MTSKIIAHRYGQAFIDYARGTLTLDSVIAESELLFKLFKSSGEFLDFFLNAQIAYLEKCSVIDTVLVDFSDPFRVLLKYLLEKQRIDHVSDILEYIRTLQQRDEKIIDTLVLTRFPLSSESVQAIQRSLEKRLKQRLQMRLQVEPSFLGGVKIIVGGDTVIDGSVKKRFADLSRKLTNAKLK